VGAVQPGIAHGARPTRPLQARRGHALVDFEAKAAPRLLRHQLGHHTRLFPDHPGGGQGHAPATLGADHFGAIEVGIRPPAAAVVFDPPGGNLRIHRAKDRLLGLLYLARDLLASAHDVERGPGEERCHGVEVRTIGLAAQPRGLKGDRPAPAKGIAHTGQVAKASPAEFLHQFRQIAGLGAQVGVDGCPGLR